VGGKTGTAHKQEGKGYTNKYRAWFVGLAPVVRRASWWR
jgi:cell division protein FtsI (penicillin-binding protein 3)